MRRVLFVPVVAVVATLLLAGLPSAQAQNGDLEVAGQHLIQIQKGSLDAVASVTETILFANDGEDNFTGTISVELDPDATLSAHFYVDGRGAPLPEGGSADRDPVPNEPAGDFVRYTFDLAEDGASFAAGETSGIQIIYTLPADDTTFTRSFTRETPLLLVTVNSVAGLAPESEEYPFQPLNNAWFFRLSPDANGPFTAGDTFSFEWVETPVPMSPLGVAVRGDIEDGELRLEADVSGGIAPYTVAWDLDGDGTCDDAEGTTTTVDVRDNGAHRATACVTDAAVPAGEARQTYEARVAEAAPTTTSPTAWVLGLVGLLVGALLAYGLVQGGMVGGGRGRGTTSTAGRSAGPALGAESRDMLELRQRVMVASLKELEIAKKKGEVPEGLYTPLKAELKQDTVRVMRELEKRKTETV